jgi:hypothetical protein
MVSVTRQENKPICKVIYCRETMYYFTYEDYI